MAKRYFSGVLDNLSEEELSSAYIRDSLSFLAEELMWNSESQQSVKLDTQDQMQEAGSEFLRGLRTGSLSYSDKSSAKFEMYQAPDNKPDILIFDTPYATLRVDTGDGYTSGVTYPLTVKLRELSVPEKPTAGSLFLKLWSIGAVLLIIVLCLSIERVRRAKGMRWVVMSVCVALYASNAIIVASNKPPLEDGVGVTVPDGVSATLAIPIHDSSDVELVVFNGEGEPQPTKYNQITNTVDAIIGGPGDYSLKVSAVYYSDIKDKSAEIQEAIRVLTSTGLMDGATERTFLPDREITRAEFLSAVVRVMGLLDAEAVGDFPDVLKTDWYYPVAASVAKEGIVEGFEDGTFRGNEPIPKVQMVMLAGNTLIRTMDYSEISPEESHEILTAFYTDAEKIPDWAAGSVALATKADLVPVRDDGGFDPQGVMTRADAALLLYRLYSRIW
jgi:hypothetical protein